MVGEFKFYHHLKEHEKLGTVMEVQLRVIISLSMPDKRRQGGRNPPPPGQIGLRCDDLYFVAFRYLDMSLLLIFDINVLNLEKAERRNVGSSKYF